MKRHLAVAFVVTTTFLAPSSALARGTSRTLEPQVPGEAWAGESGLASYYGPTFKGPRAADGARFDQMALTAAHPWLPFGTKVKVTLAAPGVPSSLRSLIGSPPNRRIVDLSVAAARQLGMINRGLAEVSLLPV
jgi:rare lipoprotein A